MFTKENQVIGFWQDINSLDSYIKKQTGWAVEKETSINGERLVWLKNHEDLKLVTYHNFSIYEFNVYSVDAVDLENFISSFRFLKDIKNVHKKFIDNDKGFYFTHPFDVFQKSANTDKSLIAQLSNLSTDYPDDIISVSYFEAITYKDFDAKFGSFQLQYSEGNKCWESFSISERGGNDNAPLSCVKPVLYTDSGLPVFQSTLRWKTYVIPIDKTRFIRVNITGSGATKPLDDIIKSFSKI